MKNKVSVLTEIFEGSDGIREFQIIAVYKDKDKAIKKMNELIHADEYGWIYKNGINSHMKDSFSTNYIDGFLEYSVGTYSII